MDTGRYVASGLYAQTHMCLQPEKIIQFLQSENQSDGFVDRFWVAMAQPTFMYFKDYQTEKPTPKYSKVLIRMLNALGKNQASFNFTLSDGMKCSHCSC